jgi:hypothetical protein
MTYPYFPLGARQRLIEAFETVMTAEQAAEVVEALDGYLEEDSGRAVFVRENLTPNYRDELEKLRTERDAAVNFAEQLLKKAQEALEALRLPEK